MVSDPSPVAPLTALDRSRSESSDATQASAEHLSRAQLFAPPLTRPPPPVETWREPQIRPADLDQNRARRRLAERRRRERSRVWSAAFGTGVKIGLVLFVAYGFLFNFSVVRGSSMSPGIHDGDRIVVDHLSYLFRDVARGDIIVLEYPLDPTLDYIKRVIGLPGDAVLVQGGGVWVNGHRLEEPYVAQPDPSTHLKLTVAADTLFVLGDNRPHSSDSREFGLVPRENVVGKVDLRVWPPARLGVLD